MKRRARQINIVFRVLQQEQLQTLVMKDMPPYLRIAAAWAFITVAFCGCSENSPTQPLLKEAEVRVLGDIPLSEEKAIVVTNPIGAVVLMGEGREQSVSWLLDKTVQAATAQKAREQFDAIVLSQQSRNDTLFVSVAAPLNSAIMTYAADLSLNVPLALPCAITQAHYGFAYDLAAPLLIQNTSYAEIQRHNASCQIDLPEGGIVIEMALPRDGICHAHTGKGDILLRLPATTSALIAAESKSGKVMHSGLVFVTLDQTASALTGTLGLGMGEIRLETANGNIQLEGY